MKVFHNLYSQTISLENLLQAWEEFKKGKRHKKGVGEFELHLEDNLFDLHRQLANKTYRHGKYSGFFITDPKLRHIHKAEVMDRIVHHALFKTLSPIFEPTFISDSYSCRKGYGTHKGFKKLVVYVRKVSRNYTCQCWALKSDIKKFFDSVNHDVLFEIIKKRVKDEELLWLIKEIIESYNTDTKDCFPFDKLRVAMTNRRKGIPIGNLTSQLFANIYLNELDQFVKHELKVKYYLRYADDFVILHENREVLNEYLQKIEEFLILNLGLELHPRKTIFRKLKWGIDFLGYVVLPHYQLIRTKTKRRIIRKIEDNVALYKAGKISKYTMQQSIASYRGILRHAYTNKIRRKIDMHLPHAPGV